MIEAGCSPIVRKVFPVGMKHAVFHFKSQKCQGIALEECGDIAQRHLLFLSMEQEVAAGAHAKKIAGGDGYSQLFAVLQIQQFLAASANLIWAGAKTPLGDQVPGARNIASGRLAIEADQHESARAEQGQQYAPSGERVGQMMQHPGTFYDIEVPADYAKFQKIALRKFYGRQAQFPRLALGIAEAAEAQIHREQARLYCHGNFDGDLAGAATGAEQFRAMAAA